MSTFEHLTQARKRHYDPRDYAPNYIEGLAEAFALGQIISGDSALDEYVTHLTGYAFDASDIRDAFQEGREWCNHDANAVVTGVCECGVTVS